MTLLKRLVVGLLVVYGLICGLAFVGQRKLIYQPPDSVVAPSTVGLEQVFVPNGTVLFFRAPPEAGAPVLYFTHGNGSQIGSMAYVADLFPGCGFVAVEYPGYPLAREKGPPTEAGIMAAALAGLSYTTETLKVSREQLVLVGHSLGTGVATGLAAAGWGKGLVLVSPFTDLAAAGAKKYPFLPVRYLITDRFASIERAPSITIPTLIAHGTLDDVVPYEEGVSLSRAFPNARLVTLEGATHANVWQREDMVAAIQSFIDSLFPPAPGGAPPEAPPAVPQGAEGATGAPDGSASDGSAVSPSPAL